MLKILFVCHGNICRSPMAEFVMKDMVLKAGIAENFEIASAATSNEEIGNDIYPPVRRILSENGIAFEHRAARRMTIAYYDYYDYLIAMDAANLRNMQRICGGDPANKISLLLEHAGAFRDVADPWYTGQFQQTWDDVNRGCTALLEELRTK